MLFENADVGQRVIRTTRYFKREIFSIGVIAKVTNARIYLDGGTVYHRDNGLGFGKSRDERIKPGTAEEIKKIEDEMEAKRRVKKEEEESRQAYLAREDYQMAWKIAGRSEEQWMKLGVEKLAQILKWIEEAK